MSDKIDEKLVDMEETTDTSTGTTENKISTIEDVYKRQEDLVNENTEFAIQQIENQKADTTKEYEKEQANAYKDYMHATNPYGVNAEQMAAAGLSNSGYSESAKVAMFNQYQNRLMAARKIYATAMRDWDMEITRARMQNKADLLEIAINAFKSTLSLAVGELTGEDVFSDTIKSDTSSGQSYKDVYENIAKSEREDFWNRLINKPVPGAGVGTLNNAYAGAAVGSAKNESFESLPQITKDSLIAAGMAGKSAEEIDREIRNGNLVETEDENGNLIYKRVRG